MVHVNETIVIKSSSPKLAEWVKRLKEKVSIHPFVEVYRPLEQPQSMG